MADTPVARTAETQTSPEDDRALAEWHQRRFLEANGDDTASVRSGGSDSVRGMDGPHPLDCLARAGYVMSEPHLSGYRLVLGFETLDDVQAAHEAVAAIRAGHDR